MHGTLEMKTQTWRKKHLYPEANVRYESGVMSHVSMYEMDLVLLIEHRILEHYTRRLI